MRIWCERGVRTDHATGSFELKGSVVPVLELLAGRMEQKGIGYRRQSREAFSVTFLP